MTNKKATKRALILSIISMFICVVMLAGTTFAWFTDSVTSGVNRIIAGNLDVELYHTNDKVTNEKVTDQTEALFKDVTLWEPGAVAYETFDVENVGNLALKYDLSINFAEQNTVVDNGKGLASALSVGVINGALDANASRDDVIDEVNGNWSALSSFVKSGTLDAGTAGAPTSDTYTVVIYWEPKDNDNDWNVNNERETTDGEPLNIDLGVKLFATQNTVEVDSFDNQYDVNAPYTEVATFDELNNALAATGKVKLTADITATNNQALRIAENTSAVIDLNGKTFTSKDGGNGNWFAIYVSKNASLVLNDSVGTGKIVSSCYGVYVQVGASFVMNGGTLDVSGNGTFDYAVVLWNSQFVMNAGTINSRIAVVPSNYYKNRGEASTVNSVTIKDGCTLNSTTADIDLKDALDTTLNVPAGTTIIP